MTDSSEAEKAFEKFEPGFYGSGNTYTDRRTTWLAALSRARAAGIEEWLPRWEAIHLEHCDECRTINDDRDVEWCEEAVRVRSLSQQEDGKGKSV